MPIDQLKAKLGNHKWALLVAFVMLLMVFFGYKLAQQIEQDNQKTVDAQRETIAHLLEENNALTTKVHRLEMSIELEKLQTQNITKQVQEKSNELDAQKELIAFYERVVAPEKTRDILSIEGVEVISEGNSAYQLRFVVLQSQLKKAILHGSLEIQLNGTIDDKPVTLRAGDAGFIEENIKYRFRFFQAVNLHIVLPEKFVPSKLVFSTDVFQYKTRKASYSYDVPWEVSEISLE